MTTTAPARPRPQHGVHVSDLTLWQLRNVCRRLGMTEAGSIARRCATEGVPSLELLGWERAEELLTELQEMDTELTAADVAHLEAHAARLSTEGRDAEAAYIRWALRQQDQGPAWPV